MSIRDNMIQQVLGNPGKYSIQQLEAAMKSGSLPAYVVVPIIQDKVQQQKQMQAAMAMQQQPPQSTVAEQVMQEAGQMGGGVEQLPSNLPQEYASGGIVAFDEGGEVERYQEGGRTNPPWSRVLQSVLGLPVTEEELEEERIKEERRKILEQYKRAQLAPGEAEQQQYYGAPDRRLVNTLKSLVPGAGDAAIPSGMEAEMSGAYQAPSRTPAPVMGRPDMMSANRAMAGTPPPYQGIADLSPSGITGPAGGTGFGGLTGTMDEIRALQEKEGIQPTARQRFAEFAPEFRKTVEGIEGRRKAEAERLRGQMPGEAYESLEKQLQKEAEEAGADKQQAKNMAIFKAGLAMMAGTSRNALENISKGAMVGAEEYQRAASEIKKAQKENQRMMAHIEQARRAEKRGDIERQVDELDKAASRELKVEEYLAKGLMEAGIDDDKTIRALFKDRLTVAGQMGVAGIQAKSREDLATLRAELGGPKGALTEYQKRTLIAREQDRYPIDQARMEYAKSKGWSKVPKVGENPEFDGEAERYWLTKVHTRAGLPYDSGAVAGASGRAAPRNYQGFETLSVR